MNITSAFHGIRSLCIDSAPLIYAVEKRAVYITRMQVILDLIRKEPIQAFSASIALSEVLVKPLQNQDTKTVAAYRQMLLHSRHFQLISITPAIAEEAAALRARYNLKTPDALQIAVAVSQRCDAFLTNDLGLKRVTEMQVLVLDELEV